MVMLTTKVERGRVKCHQYWPDLYETVDYGLLQVTCLKEEETPSFAFREFALVHLEVKLCLIALFMVLYHRVYFSVVLKNMFHYCLMSLQACLFEFINL